MNEPVSGLSSGIGVRSIQRTVDVPEQVVLDPHVGVEGGEVEGRGGLRHVCDATHARPSVSAIVRGSADERAQRFQTTFSGSWVMLTTGFGEV